MVIFFQEREQKRHQELQANLLAIKYVQTVHKIITTRLEKKLDENQPREQARFRSKYSTTDHIHAINQLKLKRSAVNKTLYYCVLLSWITRRHSTQYKPKLRANIHLGGQTEFCPNGERKLFEADQIRWGGGSSRTFP